MGNVGIVSPVVVLFRNICFHLVGIGIPRQDSISRIPPLEDLHQFADFGIHQIRAFVRRYLMFCLLNSRMPRHALQIIQQLVHDRNTV